MIIFYKSGKQKVLVDFVLESGLIFESEIEGDIFIRECEIGAGHAGKKIKIGHLELQFIDFYQRI